MRMPRPRAAPSVDSLPHPVTFFLSAGERKRVLRALKRLDRDRARALRVAVKLAARAARPQRRTTAPGRRPRAAPAPDGRSAAATRKGQV